MNIEKYTCTLWKTKFENNYWYSFTVFRNKLLNQFFGMCRWLKCKNWIPVLRNTRTFHVLVLAFYCIFTPINLLWIELRKSIWKLYFLKIFRNKLQNQFFAWPFMKSYFFKNNITQVKFSAQKRGETIKKIKGFE